MLRTLHIALLAAAQAVSYSQPHDPVGVFIWDYAGLEPVVIDQMAATATKVLGRAGVSTVWASCAIGVSTGCPERPDPMQFWIRIIPSAPSALAGSGLGGQSMVGADGVYVTVFAGRLMEIAALVGLRAGTLFGYTAAHEIGHLLLGAGSHSRTGVMRGLWILSDYEAMGRGWLAFRPDEADKLRREIDRRRTMLATARSAGLH